MEHRPISGFGPIALMGHPRGVCVLGVTRRHVPWWVVCAACLAAIAGCGRTGPAPGARPTKEAATGKLIVTVSGVPADVGRLRCGLFTPGQDFTSDEVPFWGADLEITKGHCEWVLEGVPYGEYAVAVFHDANRNGVLDKNVVGIPQESFGFSRNPNSPYGPPGYDDVKFTVHQAETRLSIRMR